MKKPPRCRCGKGLKFVKKKIVKKPKKSKRGRGMYLRPYRNFP